MNKQQLYMEKVLICVQENGTTQMLDKLINSIASDGTPTLESHRALSVVSICFEFGITPFACGNIVAVMLGYQDADIMEEIKHETSKRLKGETYRGKSSKNTRTISN